MKVICFIYILSVFETIIEARLFLMIVVFQT